LPTISDFFNCSSLKEVDMTGTYWNDWYVAWGWFLWFGMMILIFSSAGNWGYTYRVHRGYGRTADKDAVDILNERYARGEINHAEYGQMKTAIAAPS
jgi:putative membrane protein